jgi:hypothetical protein
MTARVTVDPHKEIVLALAYLHHTVQVAPLKVTVKHEFLPLLDGGVHALEDARVFGLEIGVELSEVGAHMLVVVAQGALVFEGIGTVELLVHFKTAREAEPCVTAQLPR